MASGSIDRAPSPKKSSNSDFQEGRSARTAQESTGSSIGLPGANTGLAGQAPPGKTSPPPTFRVGSSRSGGFGKIRSTASEPCPVCGRSGCSYRDDRELLICWRGSDRASVPGWRYVEPGKSGGSLYAREDSESGLRSTFSAVEIPTLPGSSVWASRASKHLEHVEADARRRELAKMLGVSPVSLAGLSVGWKPGAHGVGAWTYPQRTASGEVVSVGLRLNRDEDRQRYDYDGKTKSPPGLIYVPGRWLTSAGPVLSVEGMSDVAALDTIGLDAVGHPGNSPRGLLLDELEKILRSVPDDRPIVAVAERDPGREDDPDSPGRKGARLKAQALANRLGRRVGVALPPDGAKDSRAWVREHAAGASINSPDDRAAARDRFVSGLLAAVDWIDPEASKPEPPSRLEKLVDAGREVELEDYRRDMRERLADWVSPDKPRGRIAVLAGPAGCGKTTAVDEIAVPAYEQTAFGIPTHENVSERRAALLRLPILDETSVAAYPRLDATTCISFTQEQADALRAQGHRKAQSAEKAQRYGFGVRGTACRGCPLAPWRAAPPTPQRDENFDAWSPEAVFGNAPAPGNGEGQVESTPESTETRCGYWRAIEQADAARVKIATLERLRRTAAQVVSKDRRSLVSFDERGFESLFPTAVADDWLLEELANALEGAALRIENEHGMKQVEEQARAVLCNGSKPHDFETRRFGDTFVDVCRNCGERVTLGKVGRKKPTRKKAPEPRPIFDTDEDRSRRRVALERERERSEREEKKAARVADQVEHVRQLAAVARQITDRLREKRDGRSFGAVVVPIVRERRTKKGYASTMSGPYTGKEQPIFVRGRAVKQPARILADVLERSLPVGAIVNAEALELVRRAHACQLERLVLVAEELDGGATSKIAPLERRVVLSAIGTWETRLPEEADILVLDGTLDVAALSKRLGRDVENISPPDRVRRQAPAVQLAADITRGTAPSVVARTLEQALAALPGSKRVGLILLGKHEDALFPVDPKTGKRLRTKRSRELVPDDVYARIARDEHGEPMIEHFGGGKDRGSNLWIKNCDGLILLGTPRPKSIAVLIELVRRREDAALERGSAWGRVDWEARTLDGKVVRCKGRGYLDPVWASAADAVTRTMLGQGLERGRTVLAVADGSEEAPGGIPVLVVSGEPCGLPVVDSLPAAISKGARKVAGVVRRLVEESKQPEDTESRKVGKTHPRGSSCAKSPIGLSSLLIGEMAQAQTIPAPVVLESILAGEAGQPVPVRSARRWIAEALAAGLIVKSGATSSTVYGLPEPLPESRQPEPDSGRGAGSATSSPPEPSKSWSTAPSQPDAAPTLPRSWATAPSCPQQMGRGHRLQVDTGPPPRTEPGKSPDSRRESDSPERGGGQGRESTKVESSKGDTLGPKGRTD